MLDWPRAHNVDQAELRLTEIHLPLAQNSQWTPEAERQRQVDLGLCPRVVALCHHTPDP